MTRRIIYANQLGNSLFALQDQKEAMLSQGFLAQAILGTDTQIDGLNCIPNSPADMTVLLSQGTIFKYIDVDATPYGELPSQIPADTTNSVVKLAYNVGSFQTPTFNPPATVGFSRNDLIQISLEEVDGDNTNIPFWGGSVNYTINGVVVTVPNPPVSQTKNMQRLTNVVINIKQGTPAATGTQTTPTPDPGYVGAWVITVANGQTSITGGDIAQYPGAPFITEKLKDKISIPVVQAATYIYAVTSGAANTYTANLTPAISAYTEGMVIRALINVSNTGASTININGLGAKSIKVMGGYTLLPNEMQTGMLAELFYDGTDFILLNPARINFLTGANGIQTIAPGSPTKFNSFTSITNNYGFWDNTLQGFKIIRPGRFRVSVLTGAGNASSLPFSCAAIYYVNGVNVETFFKLPSAGGANQDFLTGGNVIEDFALNDEIELYFSMTQNSVEVNPTFSLEYLSYT